MTTDIVYDLITILKSMCNNTLMNIEDHIGYIKSVEKENMFKNRYKVLMIIDGRTLEVLIRANLGGL